MPAKEMKNDTHSGHRQRLRQRYNAGGLRGFHDYEIMELLLTYAIPRKDTKKIAKSLIGRFKSVKGVLDADRHELETVPGIKEYVSLFIRLLKETIAVYFEYSTSEKADQFTDVHELVTYFKALLGGTKNEVVRVLYLNSQNQIIHAENLSEGTVNKAVVFPRKIVEGALTHRASSVIMAHNHPGGTIEPSEDDDHITAQVQAALRTVDITLQEHLIISDEGYYSYNEAGKLDE
jgi:DNA repair protein RadC